MKSLSPLFFVLGLTNLSLVADTEIFGPPLDSGIVAIYVAPTRSDEPFVATDTQLFQHDKKEKSWTELYSPPWKGSAILGVSGYTKSSQMLYLVHSQGIAASRDSGQNWTESVPPGFGSQSGQLRSISVNPENRKEAVFAFENGCWITRDYGVNFEAILPGEKFAGAAYVTRELDENPVRIVVTDKAVHLDTDSGFVSISPSTSTSIKGVVAHPQKDFLYLSCIEDQMFVLNTTSSRGRFVDLDSTAHSFPIFSTESSLWSWKNGKLSIFNFMSPGDIRNYPVSALGIESIVAYAHPRQPDALYVAQGPQLSLVANGFQNLPSRILSPIDQESFLPLKKTVQNLEMKQMETRSAGNPSLSAMIAAEPSLPSIIGAAAEYNLQNPELLEEWNRKARSRHWMPEFRIAGYAREGTLDVTRLETTVDRFGIEDTNDLRLSDELRTYNTAAVFLEWNLQELIYDEEQVDVARERRYQADYRRKLATEITKLYYDRIELIAAFKGISHTVKTKALSDDQLYLGIREYTDLLNTICGQELFRHVGL